MIYTVTFNPAIDYVVHTDTISLGEVNRATKEEMYIGGKGINVSQVLKELGFSSKALGFVAGFTGEAIEKGIQEKGIDCSFVHLAKGASRINVKIKAGEETELNGQGPEITQADIDKLMEYINEIQDNDTLVLAGSIPSTLPSNMYEQILEKLQGRNIQIVVDATKELLVNVLKYHPFLIKPNHHELAEIFQVKLQGLDDIEKYAKKLQEMGAKNVLVSMAGDGALLVDENQKVHVAGVCKGQVKNSVGAGDSMVAGFLAGSQKKDYGYALKLATAAGGATAFSEGLATKEVIERLL